MTDLAKIVDDLSKLTVLEAAELAKKLEEKWGVSAAAPVAFAPGAAAPGAARGAVPPATAPAPSSGRPGLWAGVGAGIGLLALLQGRRRGSRSSLTLPLSPTGVSDPLTDVVSSALPSQPVFLSGSELVDDPCNCAPRRRGKKRKCLAKAQLTWRSGPKKGKAAGSKCYRFAT